MKNLTLIILLMVSPMSFAGNEVGNGGDVVVCAKSLELLDYYEARILKRFSVELPKEQDAFAIAAAIVNRLKELNPQLHKQYMTALKGLKTRVRWIEDAKFRDVPDSFEVAIPKDCNLEQIAIQQELQGKTTIHIANDLWKRLDAGQQAGLLVHELIYEHYLNLGETNSIKARLFNSYLASLEIQKTKRRDFEKFLRSLKLPLY